MAGAISGHVKLAGVAPAARLLAVRAFGPGEGAARGATFGIVAGLDWAADKGARVVSMSFAGPPDPLLERMVLASAGKGIALIAAAGNDGPNAPPLYPAAYGPVIAVAAVDDKAKVYRQAVRGTHVRLAAPGVDVLAAAPRGGYDLSTGTSIACAEVSGIAALVLERNPGIDLAGLRKILGDSARKIDGEAMGAADAEAALRATGAPAHNPSSDGRSGERPLAGDGGSRP
jgi:subtilisin family serine protease